MRILVRQQVARRHAARPVCKIAGLYAIFRAAVMLQPDTAKLIGDGKEEVVVVIMLRAKQFDRLVDQLFMGVDLFRRCQQFGRLVRKHIKRDARRQRKRLVIAARKHG